MQYSKTFTDALQFMWGAGFLSPGGPEEVTDMLRGHDISGRRILDIGSGLGGVDALLVEAHGAGEVIGIDVEEQLVDASRALIVSKGLTNQIKFKWVEPGLLPFPNDSFDMVFSKDAMVHIPDKEELYREVLRVIKPGGWFVAADWLWAENAENSPIVNAWLSKGPLKFVFTTPAQAAEAMRAAGFSEAAVVDRRRLLRESNRKEVEILQRPARERLAVIVGEEMAQARLASARGRQSALDSSDLIPCHLRGRRPALAKFQTETLPSRPSPDRGISCGSKRATPAYAVASSLHQHCRWQKLADNLPLTEAGLLHLYRVSTSSQLR